MKTLYKVVNIGSFGCVCWINFGDITKCQDEFHHSPMFLQHRRASEASISPPGSSISGSPNRVICVSTFFNQELQLTMQSGNSSGIYLRLVIIKLNYIFPN